MTYPCVRTLCNYIRVFIHSSASTSLIQLVVLQKVSRRQMLYNKRHRYWDYSLLTRTQKHTNVQPSKAGVIISIRKTLLDMNSDIFLLVSQEKSFIYLSFLDEGRACLFAWCVCWLFLGECSFFFFFLQGGEGQERRRDWFFCFCFVFMEAITKTDQEFDGLLFRQRQSGDRKSTDVLWLIKRIADKACTQSVST